jgi:hypothetical protein
MREGIRAGEVPKQATRRAVVALTAQGEQRRSSCFNIDRNIPAMRINRFSSAFASLFAVMIGATNAIAEQAGSTNPLEQTVYQTKGIVLDARDMANWASASYLSKRLGKASD